MCFVKRTNHVYIYTQIDLPFYVMSLSITEIDCNFGQQISLDVSVLDCVYMLMLSYVSITK